MAIKHLITNPFGLLSRNLVLWHEVVQQRSLMDMARQRVLLAGSIMAMAYLLVGVRLVDVMVLRSSNYIARHQTGETNFAKRTDVLDRNGEVLATQLITASVYANPKVVLNAREAAEKLATILPEVGFEALHQKMSNKNKGFLWLARHVTPKVQQAINQAGIPGVYLQKDYRRVYPHGRLFAHVLGYCGVDGEGLSGVEKSFDERLRQAAHKGESLKLSLDLRVQHIVHDELDKAVTEFKANGGNAMVMDVKTGAVLSMVSLPTFDPNLPNHNTPESTFNRNTLGVYEPGSTFKILNVAIALESGKAGLDSLFDARFPVKIGPFKVDDFKGKYRMLTLTEAFIYSSNIASIKIAQTFGSKLQREYLQRFGLFKAVNLEIPEIGHPLVPANWSEATLMTVSYGYGISVSPIQTLRAVAGVLNDGYLVQPTLLHLSPEEAADRIARSRADSPLLTPKTVKAIRSLMRMVVHEGTAKKADIDGYEVMGKTGTAYQSRGKGGYGVNKTRTTTFIGAFPQSDPQYALIVMLDDPKASKDTYGYATAGWNAAPTAGKMIARMAPLLGLNANLDDQQSSQYWMNIAAPAMGDTE